MIHVVVADDHAVVRAGVRAVLASEPDVSLVAEAGDGAAAVVAVLAHAPEVLLLDWTLPGDGRTVLERVRTDAPATRVCVISMHQDGTTIREALGAGALGYVVKGAGIEHLVTALRAVAAGRRFLDPAAEGGLSAGPEPEDDDSRDRDRALPVPEDRGHAPHQPHAQARRPRRAGAGAVRGPARPPVSRCSGVRPIARLARGPGRSATGGRIL
jgi:DNA-binding NarL/FixJ family response regulator